VYLAGPFFNPAQRERFETLEAMFNVRGISYYSPREESVNRGFKIENVEQADEALNNDLHELRSCHVMLVQLDYLLPAELQLAIVQSPSPEVPLGRMQPVHIPDTGTVWEAGFAQAVNIPRIGLLTGKMRLNIMLARTLNGVALSLGEIGEWLNGGPVPAMWTGEMR